MILLHQFNKNLKLFLTFEVGQTFFFCLPEHSRYIEQTPENYNTRNRAPKETNYKNQKKKTMKNNYQQSQNLTPSVVGVDIGSHFTKIAAVNKGAVDVITNEANLRQTPTVAGYGPKQRMFGEAGYSKMKSNLANIIVAPHRYLGFSSSTYVQDQSKYSSCQPKHQQQKIVFKVQSQGDNLELTPQQVTASFLTKIDSTVELNKLDSKYLVVAVPDYFTHNERQSMLDSIKIAQESQGKNYGYAVINESTAVGIDYGFYKMNQFPEKEEDAKIVLFIDFGHSKLSLYAIKFTKHYQKVIFQKHIRQLGCKNLDQLMFEYYSQLFQKNNQDLQINVKESKKAVMKMFQNIEKQRKVLKGISDYDFSIECLLEDKDFSYTMTRDQFQEISKPIIQQIAVFFQSAKESMTKLGVDFTQIQLLGGGSRIPIFIKTVTEIFGKEPSRTLNSSESIARGAALSAAMQSSIFRVKPYLSFDICASGVICSWKGQGEDIENESNQIMLMEPNELIIGEKQVDFQVKPTQKKMVFSINDLNTSAGLQSRIVSFALLFPQIQEGKEEKIRIVADYDSNKMINKILAFHIREKEEPLQLQDLTFFKKLNHKEVEQMILKEKESLQKDAKIIKSYQQRNLFQSKLYAFKDELQRASRNQQTKDFIDLSKYNQCISELSELEEKLEEIQDFQEKMDQLSNKKTEFFNQITVSQQKYKKVREELQKLEYFIESMIAGKIKEIRYYPGEQVEKVKQWISQMNQRLEKEPKFNELATSLEEIKKLNDNLKEKIEECQAEARKKEKQYYRPEAPHYNLRNRHNNNFDFDPFRNTYRGYEAPRGRGRSGYNTFGNGFFPNFSGFF